MRGAGLGKDGVQAVQQRRERNFLDGAVLSVDVRPGKIQAALGLAERRGHILILILRLADLDGDAVEGVDITGRAAASPREESGHRVRAKKRADLSSNLEVVF